MADGPPACKTVRDVLGDLPRVVPACVIPMTLPVQFHQSSSPWADGHPSAWRPWAWLSVDHDLLDGRWWWSGLLIPREPVVPACVASVFTDVVDVSGATQVQPSFGFEEGVWHPDPATSFRRSTSDHMPSWEDALFTNQSRHSLQCGAVRSSKGTGGITELKTPEGCPLHTPSTR